MSPLKTTFKPLVNTTSFTSPRLAVYCALPRISSSMFKVLVMLLSIIRMTPTLLAEVPS